MGIEFLSNYRPQWNRSLALARPFSSRVIEFFIVRKRGKRLPFRFCCHHVTSWLTFTQSYSIDEFSISVPFYVWFDSILLFIIINRLSPSLAQYGTNNQYPPSELYVNSKMYLFAILSSTEQWKSFAFNRPVITIIPNWPFFVRRNSKSGLPK